MKRPHPAQHVNQILDRVLSGMGGEEGVSVVSRQEYQELALGAAEMVRSSFTKERKQKAAGLCLQYLRLSLCPPVAPEQDTNQQCQGRV